MKKFLLFTTLALIVAFILAVYQQTFTNNNNSNSKPANTNSKTEDIENQTIIAQNLEVPWAMDFLPNGNLIFTQRPGKISIVESDGTIVEIGQINVTSIGESGLHGIALDPDFDKNNFIYIYYTYKNSGENTLNRVSRFTLEKNNLSDEKIIVDNIPGAPNHDGGRIKFGPNDLLYITTGDAQEPSLAQNKNSLAGKILRVDKNGQPADENPFNSRVYSYGHRNPQGITWDSEGNLWSTEHGRSGVLSGLDELNKISKGGNFGWPEIEGDETRSDIISPIINSGGNTTWAPGGAAYLNGSIFFTGLRGSALYKYDIETNELNEYLKNTYGRIRDVVVGPDNFIYISTSNLDGRGIPNDNDDKIIKINPESLN